MGFVPGDRVERGDFFLGFRGFALIPALTVLAVLNKRGFRLSKRVYVLGLVVVLVAIPAVTVMRASPVSERSISEALSSARPLAALKEMGASLRPLVHTLHYMETESYRWGKTYWRGLISVVPNLSSQWKGVPMYRSKNYPPVIGSPSKPRLGPMSAMAARVFRLWRSLI